LGFKKEGYLRERWLTSEETQDSLFYGLLKKEWCGSSTYKVLPPSTSHSSFLNEVRAMLTGTIRRH
jgi:hypothetical protein